MSDIHIKQTQVISVLFYSLTHVFLIITLKLYAD